MENNGCPPAFVGTILNRCVVPAPLKADGQEPFIQDFLSHLVALPNLNLGRLCAVRIRIEDDFTEITICRHAHSDLREEQSVTYGIGFDKKAAGNRLCSGGKPLPSRKKLWCPLQIPTVIQPSLIGASSSQPTFIASGALFRPNHLLERDGIRRRPL